MRHPLWVLNSSLLFLVLLTLLFVWFSQERIPRRGGIEPREYPAIIKEVPTINIAKIYEHDLFDTYIEPSAPPLLPALPLPLPPKPKPPYIPIKERPSFLEPLPITLKGIIIVSQNDAKSMATISDNRTNQEAIYKVGDTIEDAQLIRIFRNKVVFVRTNGQQEILYLREKDAQEDPVYTFLGNWEDVIDKISDTEFTVDPGLFAERVQNLAQFIDILDLTTAYKRGKNIGCRIGAIAENSLGSALGLHSGDIILTINTIPATSATDRYTIYKAVISTKTGDTIRVSIQRAGQTVALLYFLRDAKRPEIKLESGQIVAERAARPEEIKEKEIKGMQECYTFAPTVEQIRTRERENMLRRGKRPRHSIAE
ncbi:hypothetical protein E3J79_02975 [Candidatus Dependentiae bacterium]|nr:MAG: hypothetical protein E3J79_02975 [Candidatus Dependentiae bacterium]